MKIRPAIGLGATLAEALEQTSEVHNRLALLEYLREHYYWMKPEPGNVSIEKYGEGIDERCGWDTHLVCIDGKAAVYTDGPFPDDMLNGKLRACVEGDHTFSWREGLSPCRFCFEKKRKVDK